MERDVMPNRESSTPNSRPGRIQLLLLENVATRHRSHAEVVVMDDNGSRYPWMRTAASCHGGHVHGLGSKCHLVVNTIRPQTTECSTSLPLSILIALPRPHSRLGRPRCSPPKSNLESLHLRASTCPPLGSLSPSNHLDPRPIRKDTTSMRLEVTAAHLSISCVGPLLVPGWPQSHP